jgi:molybdenum cofactor cytidylyltransferase
MGLKSVAAILAAGEGSRMGGPKALLEFGAGESFLRHLVAVFQEAHCQVFTVVGEAAARIEARHSDLDLIVNPGWKEGQFSSAKVGLQHALRQNAELVFLHPIDAPMLQPQTISLLQSRIEEWDAAVPEFWGRPGHPLLLTSKGARAILAQPNARHLEAALLPLSVLRCAVGDRGVVQNLNTPEEYEAGFRHSLRWV